MDNPVIKISDLVIHYTIICMIGSDKEVVYNEKYDAMVEESSEESDKFYDIISNIIDDKLISGEQLFKIAIQYSKYVKMHPILNLALKSMKITNYHLDELTKEYNGSLDILKEFDKWLRKLKDLDDKLKASQLRCI